jgi:hypothetical protein
VKLPPISEVWERLGGQSPLRGRAPALWRKTCDRNVSFNDAKGCWHDFPTDEGGGVLDLVQRVRRCSRSDAYCWLAAEFGLPTSDLTPAERAASGQARIQGRDLARLAAWWLLARISELEERKSQVVTAGANPFLLTPVASEICRLQTLGPEGVIQTYRQFEREHPRECTALVGEGRAWEQACRWAVGLVIDKIAREQAEAANAAA